MGFRYTGGIRMKKFEGWRTEELVNLSTLIAGRQMWQMGVAEQYMADVYSEMIREIRNRRVKEELGQLTITRFRTEFNDESE